MVQKRHHYVPVSLLKRFSDDPARKNPRVWVLDVSSGKTLITSAANVAAKNHFNRLEYAMGLPSNWIENKLSYFEGRAAPLIDQLVHGDHDGIRNWRPLAEYIWLQHQRTPLARSQFVFLAVQFAKLRAARCASDLPRVAGAFARRGELITPEKLREFRDYVIEGLCADTIGISAPANLEVLSPFLGLRLGVDILGRQTSWIGLRARTSDKFVLSDHPVAICDPRAGHDVPVWWGSSATVEVTFPLDPTLCLLMVPGPPTYELVDVSSDKTSEVNLRSVAHAEKWVIGPGLDALRRLWETARSDPDAINLRSPRAPALTVFGRDEK